LLRSVLDEADGVFLPSSSNVLWSSPATGDVVYWADPKIARGLAVVPASNYDHIYCGFLELLIILHSLASESTQFLLYRRYWLFYLSTDRGKVHPPLSSMHQSYEDWYITNCIRIIILN
jgi:hypothetical protein